MGTIPDPHLPRKAAVVPRQGDSRDWGYEVQRETARKGSHIPLESGTGDNFPRNEHRKREGAQEKKQLARKKNQLPYGESVIEITRQDSKRLSQATLEKAL